MNEQETISKVLTGETDIAKMSHDDFVEMLKCLDRMYFSRVMNCVDGTGKSDKEWTALSFIFSRVVEAITEKPSGNIAKLREALEATLELFWDIHNANRSPQSNQAYAVIRQIKAALAAPARNCDRFKDALDAWDAYDEWVESYRAKGETPPFNEFGWLFASATEKEGGAK